MAQKSGWFPEQYKYQWLYNLTREKSMKMLRKAARIAAIMVMPILIAIPAYAYEEGDWVLRVGVGIVEPDDSSGPISLDGSEIPNSGVSVDVDSQPALALTYMLTNNVGLEIIASAPFEHQITGEGEFSGLSIGSTKHLPPTLSLQYYFFEGTPRFQPYAGIGVNYTAFFSEDLDSQFESAIGTGDLSVDDSVGLSLQLGADYSINENWFANVAVWKMDLETTATIKLDAGPKVEVDVDVDPWVYMLTVGYKF
uniref:Outer membrane protein W n=1 Tax=Alteromonadaceae bacterium PE-TB08W TaxID=1199097 RepID=A0A3G9EEZ9_9ALTE|nr:outer membrane protein W [Alteromonadaceae bacterium PE-TB08W]